MNGAEIDWLALVKEIGPVVKDIGLVLVALLGVGFGFWDRRWGRAAEHRRVLFERKLEAVSKLWVKVGECGFRAGELLVMQNREPEAIHGEKQRLRQSWDELQIEFFKSTLVLPEDVVSKLTRLNGAFTKVAYPLPVSLTDPKARTDLIMEIYDSVREASAAVRKDLGTEVLSEQTQHLLGLDIAREISQKQSETEE